MSELEIIDHLCSVVEEMASVIREQRFLINQNDAVDEETKRAFDAKAQAIADKVESLGFSSVRFEKGAGSAGCE